MVIFYLINFFFLNLIVISLDERRKSAAIIQKLHAKKVFKNARNKAADKKASMKQKIGLMSLGEKNLFQEAKEITLNQKEETIKEQEKLKDSLVYFFPIYI